MFESLFFVKFIGENISKEDEESVKNLERNKEYIVSSVHKGFTDDTTTYGIYESDTSINANYFEKLDKQEELKSLISFVKNLKDNEINAALKVQGVDDDNYWHYNPKNAILNPNEIFLRVIKEIPTILLIIELERRSNLESLKKEVTEGYINGKKFGKSDIEKIKNKFKYLGIEQPQISNFFKKLFSI